MAGGVPKYPLLNRIWEIILWGLIILAYPILYPLGSYADGEVKKRPWLR